MRAEDGLALSSRNANLSADERAVALGLAEALDVAAKAVAWGSTDVSAIEAEMREALAPFVEAGLSARLRGGGRP